MIAKVTGVLLERVGRARRPIFTISRLLIKSMFLTFVYINVSNFRLYPMSKIAP